VYFVRDKKVVGVFVRFFVRRFTYNNYNGTASNYDKLILKLLPEKHHLRKESLYERCFIFVILSLLTDGNALLFYKTITAVKINSCLVVN
jgi:dGTPase